MLDLDPLLVAFERRPNCRMIFLSTVANGAQISANKKAGLRWVLLYVPSLLPFFSLRRLSSSGRGTTKAKASRSSITPYADSARTGLPSRRSTSIQLHVARFSGTEGQSGNWVVVV